MIMTFERLLYTPVCGGHFQEKLGWAYRPGYTTLYHCLHFWQPCVARPAGPGVWHDLWDGLY